MSLGVSYIDGTTYIYDLLYEESTISIDNLTLPQTMLLSIKLGCDLDYNMDYMDDDVRELIEEDLRECRKLIRGECESIVMDKDFAELLMKLGKIAVKGDD